MKTRTDRSRVTTSRPADISRRPVFGVVQPKLTVNKPGDRHEQEADKTAERVMRMTAPEKDRMQKAEAPEKEKMQKAEAPEKEKLQKAEAPEKEKMQKAEAPEKEKMQKAEAPEKEKMQKAEAPEKEMMQKAEAPEKEKMQKAEAPEKEKMQKAEAPEKEKVQRFQTGSPVVSDGVQSSIRNKKTGGQRMDSATRSFMESRFDSDFSNVRVHEDAESARLNGRLGARAFTTENHIFFGKDEYQPGTSGGKQLLAHELTHTIQQGASVQRSPRVSTTTSTPPIQRLGISDALDYFADKANLLPGFRLLTILLGFNPVNMASVDRSAANILRAVIELIPGATLITQALENHGVFQRAGAWVEQQMAAFSNIGGQIRQGIDRFLESLSWSDIFDLGGVWERAKSIFTTPISRIISFIGGLVTGLMDLVRQAILRPLAQLLKPTRGYDLLCAILGSDPVTGEAVPRNAETLIGGFMKLIGREDIWENIRKGNAVARAWAWFQGALSGLMAFVTSIPGQVVATLKSITWQDVVTIVGVFDKVLRLFSGIAGQFFGWAFGTIMELLEIVFSVVAPGVIPYVKKAAGVFKSILENPIGFVGNLVRAGRLGFEMFARNIVTHLKTALIKWITGPLGEAGVYIPKSFDLLEIIKLVLSVLGLTWQNIRAKLVKIIPEPVLVALEKTATILVTLVKDGPLAAWEQIKAELNELKSMMIAEVVKLVSTEIVKAAVTKIVSMINPAGAVIQAIIAIYNTVMFFVERISQIAATVGAFVDSIAAIAAGQVQAAAQRVESTLANTLTLVISFLARLVGLGGIPNKIVGIIRRIRAPIDKGLDRVVAWLGTLLKKIGAAARGAAGRFLAWWKKKTPVSGGGESHTLTFEGERRAATLVLMSGPRKPSVFLASRARAKKIADKDSKEPIQTTVTQEGAIAATQTSLAAYDDPAKPTPAGPEEKKANDLSAKLDGQLGTLAAHLRTTLDGWGASDKDVKKISVPRKSFTYEMKYNLAQAHADKSDLANDSEGRMVNLKKDRKLARRHIVSSYDMTDHYESALKGKKVSEAKLLLEQRGSAPASLTPVADLTEQGVEAAANTRHHAFFGYTKNLFIGDSRENSSIQEHLDRGKPDMASAQLLEHVSHVKRLWALDSSIKVSGLDR